MAIMSESGKSTKKSAGIRIASSDGERSRLQCNVLCECSRSPSPDTTDRPNIIPHSPKTRNPAKAGAHVYIFWVSNRLSVTHLPIISIAFVVRNLLQICWHFLSKFRMELSCLFHLSNRSSLVTCLQIQRSELESELNVVWNSGIHQSSE